MLNKKINLRQAKTVSDFLQRRRHKLLIFLRFRVTTLLADSTLPTSHCRPVPHSSGGLFLLTVDIRPRLLGIAFDRSCSQGIANPCLAAVLHDRRLSVSGDTDTSCPVQSIWLLNDSYDRPLFAVCQPEKASKSPQSANYFCAFCQRGRGRGARNS